MSTASLRVAWKKERAVGWGSFFPLSRRLLIVIVVSLQDAEIAQQEAPHGGFEGADIGEVKLLFGFPSLPEVPALVCLDEFLEVCLDEFFHRVEAIRQGGLDFLIWHGNLPVPFGENAINSEVAIAGLMVAHQTTICSGFDTNDLKLHYIPSSFSFR